MEALQAETFRIRIGALKDGEVLFPALRLELDRLPTLLVLDNFKTSYDSADKLAVVDLLKRLAEILSLTLLITTRNGSVGDLHTSRRLRVVDVGPLDLKASTDLFNNRSRTSRHAKDPALPKLLTLLDGYPLAITLIAARASEENTIEEVIDLWTSRRTAYSDDGRLLTREESLHCSLDLSLDSPLINNTAHAKDLLSLLALLPVGISHRRIKSNNLFAHLASAATAVLSTSLAHLADDPHDKTIRMLAPVAQYLRESTSRVGFPSTDILRPLALSYFESCATLPLYMEPLTSAKTPSDFLNVFEIFILAAEVLDRSFQDARANSLLDLIERFADSKVPDAFLSFLRKVRRTFRSDSCPQGT
jgi:hypothetical protein